jgi:exodeoxyribonuclease VII small subunit
MGEMEETIGETEEKEIIEEITGREETVGIEEAFELLDGLLKRLEGDELTLEESFETYAKGLELVKQCRRSIDEVEKKVLVLEESGGFHEL